MEIKENYNLKKHNTFSIGVNCSLWAASGEEEEWADFLGGKRLLPGDIIILGGGSNYLFTDDVEKIVLHSRISGMEVVAEDRENVYVKAGSGLKWDDFAAWAVSRGWGGAENLSLIPGSVGAVPVQNIGAYGVEAEAIIHKIFAIDVCSGEKVVIPASLCRFAYRDSIFKNEWKNRYFITAVVFKLDKHPRFVLGYGSLRSELDKKGAGLSLESVRETIIDIRRSKLPDTDLLPNAGSFFKNPVVGADYAEELRKTYPDLPVYPAGEGRAKLGAGWLIEACGWKGKTLGRAGVYERQALILVNRDDAAGAEIARLANEIKKSVFMKFKVKLEPEVYIE